MRDADQHEQPEVRVQSRSTQEQRDHHDRAGQASQAIVVASSENRPWPFATEIAKMYHALAADAATAISAKSTTFACHRRAPAKALPRKGEQDHDDRDELPPLEPMVHGARALRLSRPRHSEMNRIAEVVNPLFISMTSSPDNHTR